MLAMTGFPGFKSVQNWLSMGNGETQPFLVSQFSNERLLDPTHSKELAALVERIIVLIIIRKVLTKDSTKRRSDESR